ncbi:MAG: hypothetical protein RR327_05520, partial [Clostridia bacterium]
KSSDRPYADRAPREERQPRREFASDSRSEEYGDAKKTTHKNFNEKKPPVEKVSKNHYEGKKSSFGFSKDFKKDGGKPARASKFGSGKSALNEYPRKKI